MYRLTIQHNVTNSKNKFENSTQTMSDLIKYKNNVYERFED